MIIDHDMHSTLPQNALQSFDNTSNGPQIPKAPSRRIQSSYHYYKKPIINKKFMQKMFSGAGSQHNAVSYFF